MEPIPSLRSSSFRDQGSKLRIPDPAVHETIQRIVESCKEDIRISQYADTNYACKRFEKDKWALLEPLGGARVGWLVFAPKCPAIWVEETFKSWYVIPCRVSLSVFQKPTVFVCSLNKGLHQLRIEDCWMMEGKAFAEVPFSKRWNTILEFFAKKFFEESTLQQIRIYPADYYSLSNLKSSPAIFKFPFIIAQGERAARRLRVQLHSGPKPTPKQQLIEEPKEPEGPLAPITLPPGVAKAVPHESYPDTYNLSIDSKILGYAAVQDLVLSKKLRLAASEADEFLVNMAWNEDFQMYEILSLYQNEVGN